jgi:hypothetical protein
MGTMCDHCVKRDQAFAKLSPQEVAHVEQFQLDAAMRLTMLAVESGPDSEAFLNAYVQTGDDLDVLLGIMDPPAAPDTLPDWLTDADGNGQPPSFY